MKTLKIEEASYKVIEVPVMRNGKPTKRMKKEWVRECKDVEIEVKEKVIGNKTFYYPIEGGYLYNEKGETVLGLYKFGSYGKALHKSVVKVDSKGNILKTTNGYEGATGKGWGATFVGIEENKEA